MSITTHVLDLASGRPAAGIAVRLQREEEGKDWREIGAAVTDADGRARDLLPEGARAGAGTYRLTFDTLSYFKANLSSLSPSFFPEISITFSITDATRAHHVPLLLSPFGYSTYRGS
jgi:5-hydroxyisourate hydrolase